MPFSKDELHTELLKSDHVQSIMQNRQQHAQKVQDDYYHLNNLIYQCPTVIDSLNKGLNQIITKQMLIDHYDHFAISNPRVTYFDHYDRNSIFYAIAYKIYFHELLKTPVKPKKIDKPIFNFGHFKTKYEHDLKQYKIKYQYYNAQFARYQKAYHMLEKIRKTVIDYLHLGEPSDKTIPETDILECLSNRLYEVSMRLLQDAGYRNSGETWYL